MDILTFTRDASDAIYLQGTITSAEPAIRRLTLALLSPRAGRLPDQPDFVWDGTWLHARRYACWRYSLHPLTRPFRKRIPDAWPRGTYTLVAHHPAEPATDVLPGYVQSWPVEIR